VRKRDVAVRQGQDASARAHQIDLHQTGIGAQNFVLLFQILGLPGAAEFVGRAEELDDRDDLAAVRLADFQVT
jgi:hypothetical protein